MLQRAQLGTQWLLPARTYAQWLLNRLPKKTEKETRFQRYFGSVPDLTARPPYAFGTTVAVVEDVRGPKGSLDHPRGSIGQVIGFEGTSYLVWRPKKGNIVRQHAVRPLNELAMIRSGLPAAVATSEAETQTPAAGVDSDVPLNTAPAPATAAAPKPPPPPTVDVAKGTRLQILWPHKGGGSAWYDGTVIDRTVQGNGRVRHHVAYDGWPESQWWWHDLASADNEWRRTAVADAPAEPPAGPTTRSRTIRAAAAAALDHVECAMESNSSANALETFNAAIYQSLGDDALALECSHTRQLPAAFTALAAAALGSPLPQCSAATALTATAYDDSMLYITLYDASRSAAQCHKASQNVVDVETDLGTTQFKVPATYKQLLASEQRDHWIAAEQKALDSILARPGNRLVSRSLPATLGLPIAPCVTQRRIKIDPATKAIAGFKARHCVDGGRHAAMLNRLDSPLDVETTSSVADDLLNKMLIGDTALRGRNLLKADVPDAYAQGQRLGRPKTFMHLPTAFSWMRADDGSELCIELTTPMWGEAPAGFEWQIELENTLTQIGWRRAEDVPAAWRMTTPKGDCTLITIVDDLLFSESASSGYSIAEHTCKLLSDKYGDVKPCRNPTSFAGFSISPGAHGGIKLTMPQKIIEAAREHLPELLDGTPLSLPKGKQLRDMADRLVLVASPGKLTAKQRRTQQLIGSLKFIERLHPRVSLTLHRLSCVMSGPPPEAWDVACAALATVYVERDVGLTFGGAGMTTMPRIEGRIAAAIDLNDAAPAWLESHADATWGDRNVYGLILTFAGAAVYHTTKKISVTVDSSMETEAIGSSKAAEAVTYAREILRAFGTPAVSATLIGTDNLANRAVGSGASTPSRSKHFLRRYHTLIARIKEGDVTLKHVPDEHMPADFLTKWVSQSKIDQSVQYATGST